MSRFYVTTFVFSVVLPSACPALGAFLPLSSNRSVAVDAVVLGDGSVAPTQGGAQFQESDPQVVFNQSASTPGWPTPIVSQSGNGTAQAAATSFIGSSSIPAGATSSFFAGGSIEVALAATGAGIADVTVADSLWATTFNITTPTQYSISGSLGADGVTPTPARAQVELVGVFSYLDTSSGLGAVSFAESGVLAPGQYTLQAVAAYSLNGAQNNSYSAAADWQFSAVFTSVPEPTTVALAGLSLLACPALVLRQR